MLAQLLEDAHIAKQKRNIWYYLSISDVKSRFRRSKFGVGWLILQQLAFSLGAGYIWATVFGLKPADFIPFLTVGFATWGFLSGVATEGCMSFVIAGGYLKQLPLPQQLFICRTLFTQIIYFGVGIFTALFILMIFGAFNIINLLLAVPGLLILIGYGYGTTKLLAYLGAKYRDLAHALTSLFNLLFVLTPVIYPAEILIRKGLNLIVFGNPFASLIEIIRVPLITGQLASVAHYAVAVIFVTFILFLGNQAHAKWERMVAFWA